MLTQSTSTVVVLIGLAIMSLGAVYWLVLRRTASASASSLGSLRELTEEYRERALGRDELSERENEIGILDADETLSEQNQSGTSLEEKLRYAQLESLPLYSVSLAQILISLTFFLLARLYLEWPLQVLALLTGPMIVNGLIERRIRHRVKRFDADFPQFLLSVVGMLKTGLNAVQALEAAADNLEEDSVVRQEVELMLERFRVGVPEDRSIGSFGEDIAQPEIELFVQALLLSRRVGGNLSETLDRLAKQVRKRHAFKLSATSTVAQQRGSIWVIVFIMVCVQIVMWKMQPQMVEGAWTNPTFAPWSQFTIVLIWGAVMLMRKITNIKI